MRVINMNKEAVVEENSIESYWNSLVETHEPKGHKSYHELSDIPLVEVDAMAQLSENIEMLSDLSQRLSFVMREVRYLMKA